MPSYDYVCSSPSCQVAVNRIVSISARDDQRCDVPDTRSQVTSTAVDVCGAPLVREEIPSGQANLVDKQWRVKAIMSDGSRVPGSFGVGRSRTHKGFG